MSMASARLAGRLLDLAFITNELKVGIAQADKDIQDWKDLASDGGVDLTWEERALIDKSILECVEKKQEFEKELFEMEIRLKEVEYLGQSRLR